MSATSATPALAFADSTVVDSAEDAVVKHPRSTSFFRKFSLPEISTKFLFGGKEVIVLPFLHCFFFRQY